MCSEFIRGQLLCWVEILLAINFPRIGHYKTYLEIYVSLVLLKGSSC